MMRRAHSPGVAGACRWKTWQVRYARQGVTASYGKDALVNTIQTGMLIALGFLAASLLGLLVAPALWSRAVRLTTRRITQTIPLTAMEIEADRDRVRAEYAIKMHKLEALVEQVKLSGARQQIEINRRDAHVNVLETELEQLKAAYEEAQNARRVLEQTIAERLPRVEGRLSEAKKLLFTREREIGDLTITSRRQLQILTDASRSNQEQATELDQLLKLVAERSPADEVKRRERDVALRKALDGLKAKVRAAGDLLSRLQSTAGAAPVMVERADEAKSAAGLAGPSSAGRDEDKKALERQIRQLRLRTDQQAAEIARLKAELATLSTPMVGQRVSGRDAGQLQAARVAELEAERAAQAGTIEELRDELMELKGRVHSNGAGADSSGTMAGDGANVAAIGSASRLTLAERVAQAKGGEGDTASAEPAPAGATEVELVTAGAINRSESPADKPAPVEAQGQPVAKSRMRLADRIASLSRSSG